MDVDFDINEEYEKLFGKPEPMHIFDSDEEYSELRQYILMQPTITAYKSKLPFTGVSLMPYTEFAWHQEIQKAQDKSYRIFYIQQNNPDSPYYCNAAGVYDKKTKKFVILKYSYIVSRNEFSFEDFSILIARRKALMNHTKVEGHLRYLTDNCVCDSPEQAACFVLGCSAGALEWVNDKGKSLLSFYPELQQPSIHPAFEVNYTPQPKPKETTKAVINTPTVQPHLFLIQAPYIRAFGYYDPETTYFYIKKESIVAFNVDSNYLGTTSEKSRQKFLEMACVKGLNYYRVVKDTKCRSASAAASYVLGRSATYVYWRDEDGKSLHDFWPDKFTMFRTKEEIEAMKKDKESVVEDITNLDKGPHLYYIKKDFELDRSCDASGYYDSVNKKFILKEGSLLSLDVTSSYRYSANDMSRRLFIKKNCIKTSKGYKLKQDALMDSPSQAASYVLGRVANGWIEWGDENGMKLLSSIKDPD